MGVTRNDPYINVELDDQPITDTTYNKLKKCFVRHQKILKPTAIESIEAFAWASVTTAFYDENKNIGLPFIAANLMLVLNFLTRKRDGGSKVGDNLRSVLYSIAGVVIKNPIIHEGGHALTAYCLFQNPQPIVTMTGPGAGLTYYLTDGPLTDVGSQLGRESSVSVVRAMGPGAEILWGCLSLIAAQCLPDKYNQVKSHLRMTSMVQLLSCITYAFSLYISECSKSNDFCALEQQAGITPLVAISFMISVVGLVQLTLSGCNKMIRHCASSQDEHQVSIELVEETKQTETNHADENTLSVSVRPSH